LLVFLGSIDSLPRKTEKNSSTSVNHDIVFGIGADFPRRMGRASLCPLRGGHGISRRAILRPLGIGDRIPLGALGRVSFRRPLGGRRIPRRALGGRRRG
jgi:hypothetical protein